MTLEEFKAAAARGSPATGSGKPPYGTASGAAESPSARPGSPPSAAPPKPPEGLGPALDALWHDSRGEWDAAHACAQEDASREGSWVHAYLHRKEGDVGNAGYWYRRAGRTPASGSLEKEWEQIAAELLRTSSRSGPP